MAPWERAPRWEGGTWGNKWLVPGFCHRCPCLEQEVHTQEKLHGALRNFAREGTVTVLRVLCKVGVIAPTVSLCKGRIPQNRDNRPKGWSNLVPLPGLKAALPDHPARKAQRKGSSNNSDKTKDSDADNAVQQSRHRKEQGRRRIQLCITEL